ncbi:MAG: Zn-ribbon domain-containing OB-fold protein [Candidatus Binataceae bacterium]
MAEQAEAATDTGPRPIVPYLKLEPKPHLIGQQCMTCGAAYADVNRVACSKCGSTGSFKTIELSNHGAIYVFSVIHQSFPGIKTPYVTAIIDLPEGVSVRASVDGVDPEQAEKEPKRLFNLPVEMFTHVTAKDREGREVIAFSYRPVTPRAAS